MRGTNPSNRVDGWGVIEQYVAAAIDLSIDEARKEQRALKVSSLNTLCQRAFGNHRGDAAIGNFDSKPVRQTGVGHYMTADKREAVHSVSVTLERWGGASGLRPRRAATPSSIR